MRKLGIFSSNDLKMMFISIRFGFSLFSYRIFQFKHIFAEKFAVIKVQNVYILPGSPKYFQPAVDNIVSDLKGGDPLYMDHLDTSLSELKIVKILDLFAERWKGRVNIGSYPQQLGSKSSTRITFEGSKEDVLKVKEEFRKSFPANRFNDSKFDLLSAKKVIAKAQEQLHVKRALDILEECYDR